MNWRKPIVTVILASALTGCASAAGTPPAVTETRPATPALTVYHTPLPAVTATPRPPGSPTPLPSPTPTPRTHSVARGEDLGGIAFRYGISLAELMAANPQVDANAMSIGTLLVIPGGAPAANAQAPLPTPDQTVQLSSAHCAREQDGGVWCFALASNPGESDYESISAVFRIAAPDGSNAMEQTVAAALNLLPAGGQQALLVFFPAPAPWPLAASAELAGSFPRSRDDGRYVDARIENVQVEIAADGLSARLRGEVVLSGDATAARVSVSAAGMRAGDVIGARRWDSKANPPGQRIAFAFSVYSTGGVIERVALQAEARP